MDTSTSYPETQVMTIGALLDFWDVLVEVTNVRRDMQEKELERLRKESRKGV
jgi:hypothetical protein